MGKGIAMIALVAVIGSIIYLSYSINNNQAATFESRIHEISESFGKNKLTFILPPDPPQPETVIEKKEIVKQVELINGTIVNQTIIQEVEVPAQSSGLVTGTDKQTGIDGIVKRGHQYIIQAKLELYDSHGIFVQPPYRFSLTITCEFRDYCDNSRTLSTNANALTDGSGGFKYVWATKPSDSLGDYHAVQLVRSIDKINSLGMICADTTPDCRYEFYEKSITLKLVE